MTEFKLAIITNGTIVGAITGCIILIGLTIMAHIAPITLTTISSGTVVGAICGRIVAFIATFATIADDQNFIKGLKFGILPGFFGGVMGAFIVFDPMMIIPSAIFLYQFACF